MEQYIIFIKEHLKSWVSSNQHVEIIHKDIQNEANNANKSHKMNTPSSVIS